MSAATAVASNGHVSDGKGAGPAIPGAHLPTFVRLTLMVRPWWHLVVLNILAGLVNQACAIALGVVGALLVARVATGVGPDLQVYLVGLGVFTVAKAVFQWLDMWLAHELATACSLGCAAARTTRSSHSPRPIR
jgi:hypothetical protein